MNNNKISACIWFATAKGNISEILEYYKNIFESDFKMEKIISLGETPSGNSEMCEVYLFDQKYVLMSTANQHHSLNDSVSFVISCENQDEIDKYWNYFTQTGEASQCGWCIDRFKLRWQVIPNNLAELMSKPNAFEIMMKQQKIVIAEFLK